MVKHWLISVKHRLIFCEGHTQLSLKEEYLINQQPLILKNPFPTNTQVNQSALISTASILKDTVLLSLPFFLPHYICVKRRKKLRDVVQYLSMMYYYIHDIPFCVNWSKSPIKLYSCISKATINKNLHPSTQSSHQNLLPIETKPLSSIFPNLCFEKYLQISELYILHVDFSVLHSF